MLPLGSLMRDDVDGVLADDRCQRSRGGLHEIALGEPFESDPTVDWRADLGVAEINLRLLERRLRLHHARLRRRLVGLALVDCGLRDVLIAHELLAALKLQLGVDLGRLGLGEGGARLVDRCLVGCLLDAEQQVALLDVLPFGEGAFLDEARHSRNEIDLVDRRNAADVISGFRDLTAHHRRNRNGGRRGALGSRDAARRRDAQRANGGFPSAQFTTRHRVLLTAGDDVRFGMPPLRDTLHLREAAIHEQFRYRDVALLHSCWPCSVMQPKPPRRLPGTWAWFEHKSVYTST